MTMTSERSEAVDFVAPYFDQVFMKLKKQPFFKKSYSSIFQTGISIITRVPVKQQSLFKFIDGKKHS